MREVCSPNSSGGRKDKPLAAPSAKSRGVKHAAVYGDRAARSDAERDNPAPLRARIDLDLRRP
jgi:hypothetical protein